MLKLVWIGLAMGISVDVVKLAAYHVTVSVDDYVIEKALRHFGVI